MATKVTAPRSIRVNNLKSTKISSPPTTTSAIMKSAQTSPLPTTQLERRRKLKRCLEKQFKKEYTVKWIVEKEDSPLRLIAKSTESRSITEANIKKWMKVLTKVTKTRAEQRPRYVRINILTSDQSPQPMYASIYGTGTVMFQGVGYEKWLLNHIIEIISLYIGENNSRSGDVPETNLNDTFTISSPTPTEDNITSTSKASEDHKLCPVCSEYENDDMRKCQICDIWIHYDCDADNIAEDESEKRNYLCPNCRESILLEESVISSTQINTQRSVNTRATTRNKAESLIQCSPIIRSPHGVSYFISSESHKVPGNRKKRKKLTSNNKQDKNDSKDYQESDEANYHSHSLIMVDEDNTLQEEWMDDDDLQAENYSLLKEDEEVLSESYFSVNEEEEDISDQTRNLLKKKTVSPITLIDDEDLMTSENTVTSNISSTIASEEKATNHDDEDKEKPDSPPIVASENKATNLDNEKEEPNKSPIIALEKEDAINDDEMEEVEYDDLSIISGKETVNTEYVMNEAGDDVLSARKSNILISGETTQKSQCYCLTSSTPEAEDMTLNPTGILECKNYKKLENLELENKRLRDQLNSKQMKIGELELKLFQSDAEYRDEVKALRDKCIEFEQDIEEMKKSSINVEYEKLKDVDEERKKYEELFCTLNSEIIDLETRLKEIEGQNHQKVNSTHKVSVENTPQPAKVSALPIGIKDTKGNMCFIIAAIHTLCRIVPLDEHNEGGRFLSILKRTKNLLEGTNVMDNNIDEELFNATAENWTQYHKEDGNLQQGDAVEYLMSVLSEIEEENPDLIKNIVSTLTTRNLCTNRLCKKSKSTTITESIIKTSEIPDNITLSLQQVIDSFTPMFGTRYDSPCVHCGKETEETTALEEPTQTILLHVNKVSKWGQKVNIDINTTPRVSVPIHNGKSHQYIVTDVIIHQANNPTEAKRGHYITNHYNQQSNQWEKLDNQACSALSDEEAQKLNKKGVLYILRAQNKDLDDSDKIEDSLIMLPDVTAVTKQIPPPNPTSPQEVYEGGSRVFYTNKISPEQWMEISKVNQYYVQRRPDILKSRTIVNSCTNNEAEVKSKNSPVIKPTQSHESKNICWHYTNGLCRYGPRCRFKHKTHEKYKPPRSNVAENQRHASETHKNTEAIHSTVVHQSKPICPHYKVGTRCKDYEVCKENHNHPRRCREMMTFGECNKGENCAYYHPHICRESMEDLKCLDLKCPYFHLKWTKRYAEQRRDLLYSTSGAHKINTNIFHQKREVDYDAEVRSYRKSADTNQPQNSENHFLLNQNGETNNNWKLLQSTINNHLPHNQPLQNVLPPQIQSQVDQYQYPQFQYQFPISTYPGQGQYDMNAAIYTQNPQNQYSFNQVQAQVQNEQNQYPQAQHHLQETMYPTQVQDQVQNEQNQYPKAQNHLLETTYPPQDQYLLNPQTHSQNLHYQTNGCPYPDQHSRTHQNTFV